jgi:hypothetical protein
MAKRHFVTGQDISAMPITLTEARDADLRPNYPRHLNSSSRRMPDPYAVSYRLSTWVDALLYQQRQGLWVPAFAGTT